ncbi:hypothetical protein EV360DRAFT_88114 [Lentinula raphanica]|nr:hypothetical protein EV360DRAFT_88114 [Lentinula raphanica]
MADVESLNETMGAAFIGMTVAGLLLGISSLQAYIYFTTSSDSRPLRYLVGLVVLFDFVHQALITHTMYYYLISNYGKPAVLGLAVWSLLAEVLFNGFTAFCVQSFLTWKIWRLSNYNIWITGLVTALVLAEFGCVVAFGIIALVRVRTFVELAADLKGLSVTVNAFAAAGDVLIAAILTWLLQSSKTGFERSRSDTMLNKLTIYAVNTGALTSLFAVASLISILAAPNTFIYISFFFCMGRLYTNSLLASLNARKKIRGEGENVQTTSRNFSFQTKSLTKPSSFISFASKKRPGDISIQIDTTHERRAQDYSKTPTSKHEEEYELGTASTGNLSRIDFESTADIPTLPSEAHCNAV